MEILIFIAAIIMLFIIIVKGQEKEEESNLCVITLQRAKLYVEKNGFKITEDNYLLSKKEFSELLYEITELEMLNPLITESKDSFIIPGTSISISTIESVAEEHNVDVNEFTEYLKNK